MQDDYYFRPPDYQYALRSHPNYSFVVAEGDSGAAIAGYTGVRYALLLFDRERSLVEVRSREAPSSAPGERRRLWDAALELLGPAPPGLGLVYDEEVMFRRFFVDELEVGIRDCHSEAGRREIRRMEKQGLFYFYWNDDRFDVEGGGKVVGH